MAKANYSEIGTTGLATFSGQITDDFLREMRGKEGYKRFDEMRKNSAIIAALLLANEQAIRKVKWNFVSEDGEEDPRVELLEEAREGMSLSWNDHIVEALTMLPFGYSVFEIVYKRDSRNRVMWRKFAPRGQDTIYQWQFDDTGGVSGIVQQSPPTYALTPIPIEKLIVYRTRVERGNPEGRSILRAAWIPYYFTKHIQQIEAIGVERDLAGLPKIKLPPGADTADTDTSDFGVAQKMVRNVRNDEQAGIVIPDGWEFELVSTGGSRQFDTDKIIRRYESRMLMSALAQFLNLGQEAVGSLALSKDQTDFFTMSVNAVADIIAQTFTKYAIPRLLELNGYDPEGVCLEHSPAGDTDVNLLADTLQKIGSYLTWTPDDEVWLRGAMGMPEVDTETIAAERTAKMEQAIQIAQRSKSQPPQEEQDSEGDTPEEDQPEDEMSVTRFAAAAPDDRKRRQLERQMQAVLEKRLDRMRRDVMKAAKEMKAPAQFEEKPQGVIETLKAMFHDLANRPSTPVNVTVNGQPVTVTNHLPEQTAPNVTVQMPEQATPVVHFAPNVATQPPVVNVTNSVNPTPVVVTNTVNVPPTEPFTEAEITTENGKKVLRAKRNG